MRPVLFHLFGYPVDSYYVVWFVALLGCTLWTRRRAIARFGFTANDVADIFFWVFLGCVVGARLGHYFDNWSWYLENPSRILRFWEGGLSSGSAIVGGVLGCIWKTHRMGKSWQAFVEAGSIPMLFVIGIGRWGCLLAGCCFGKVVPPGSTCSFVLHFPFDSPGVFRYASQAYEALAALAFGVFLLFVERKLVRRGISTVRHALLAPSAMVFYGGYRLLFDFLRAGDRILGLRVGQIFGLVFIAWGTLWFLHSWKALFTDSNPGTN